MLEKEHRKIIEELYCIQNCEVALASLYQELIIQFPEEKSFWEKVVADKFNQARKIGRLTAMVSANFKKYSPGRFNMDNLKTHLDRLYSHVKMIQEEKIGRNEILRLILDYENSEIETKPYDVVQSSENEFEDFVYIFKNEIKEHVNRLTSYIEEKMEPEASANNLI